ncbi:non-homologous end-joining factor 1 isoform X2 [Salminus brasiliensis]|uniref:non-homologous end-joining factor 1 isoform X2 n=1 Tax=Salminus brasiliensis TaxID=930266 RepID=UPI003B831B8D
MTFGTLETKPLSRNFHCGMESMNHSEAAVSALPWVPVTVGNSKLLAKAFFGNIEYRVLLSDLSNIWEEEMSKDSIQSRAQDLNKRLKAPVEAFFAHLCSVATPCFSGQSNALNTLSHFFLEHHSSHLTVKLKSELAGLPFYWEFRCTPAPIAVVSKQMMRPLLAVTRVLQRQVGELAALLVRKDAEIQDYRENGSVLSRANAPNSSQNVHVHVKDGTVHFMVTGRQLPICSRLQTEPFEGETFRENFIAQTLPQMSALQDCLEFDSELQELYVAVNTVRSDQKRKRPVSASADILSFVPEHIAHDQNQGSVPAAVQKPFEKTQEADIEQTLPLIPAAAPVDVSTVRPKKKKAVGLFR